MRLALLVVVVLCGCEPVAPPADRPLCVDQPPLPELKRCSGCGPTVRERIVSPDRERSFHLAFVAEGFPAEDIPEFDALTTGWLDDFTARMDREVPGLSALLNVSWVDFRNVAPPDGFVLGSCATQDHSPELSLDKQRLAELVPSSLGFDAVVVVVNVSKPYRETGHLAIFAPPAVVMANSWGNSDSFAHELGHALFGLEDEYVEFDEPLPRVDPIAVSDPDLRADQSWAFVSPNVSLNPTSPKFGGATRGLEGGMRFATGVFHFGPACMMNHSYSPLCPVCQKAAAARVLARRQGLVSNPKCGLRITRSNQPGRLLVSLISFDWDGVTELQLRASSDVSRRQFPSPTAFADAYLYIPATDGPLSVEGVCIDSKGQRAETRLDVTP